MSKTKQYHSPRKPGFKFRSWGQLALVMMIGLMAAHNTALSQTIHNGKTFVPSGHLYTPNSTGLPHPNSRLGRVEADTDVYETEIYRRQVEQQRTLDRFRRFIDRDLNHPEEPH